MDIIKLWAELQKISIDILLCGVAVCFLTEFIKYLLKNKIAREQKKFITFVPFVLGIIMFSIYGLISKKVFELEYLTKGFESGLIATLIYTIYEQFVKNIKKLSSIEKTVIISIIETIVEEENLQEAMEKIEMIVKSNTDIEIILSECEQLMLSIKKLEVSDEKVKDCIKLIINLVK